MPTNRFRIKQGTTSKNIFVWLWDNSVGYPKGKTGLAWNTASLACYYIRPGQTAATAVTFANATVGTYVSGGFIQVSATNMPGYYQFGIPNGILLSGATQVSMIFKGAAGLADSPVEIELLPYTEEDIYDRVDEAVLAAETVNRVEDALRRLSVALGSKRKS